MKRISCLVAAAALLLFGSLSHARGAPTSSFVPRGPEPHSSLKDKHHAKKSGHVGAQHSAHKAGPGVNAKTAAPATHRTPGAN
jgi:hypothetical protein